MRGGLVQQTSSLQTAPISAHSQNKTWNSPELTVMAAIAENGHVPLSPQAQDAKESMQRQLLRTMANKMYASAVEEERKRRVEEMQKDQGDDSVKKRALECLTMVQEDMVRAINVMKVSRLLELEPYLVLVGWPRTEVQAFRAGLQLDMVHGVVNFVVG